jgi:hypothetical protein
MFCASEKYWTAYANAYAITAAVACRYTGLALQLMLLIKEHQYLVKAL